jgi:hypothetical protein
VIRETTFPLEEEERRLVEAAAPGIAAAKVERAIAEKRLKRLQETAANDKDAKKRDQAKSEALELSQDLPPVPPEPQLLLDDATPEALAKTLDEQDGCIAIVSEEAGTLFEMMCGKYREGVPDLDVYLKAYDGGSIRVNRISRESLAAERATLTIMVTPQPAILDRLAERSELRGRGLLGRILFIIPPSRVGTRMYQNVAIDAAAKAAYGEALGRILRLPRCSREDPHRRLVIRGKALEIWAEYADQVEREQADGGWLYGVRDWASKHASRVARIAGIFHLLDPRNWPAPFAVPIAPETVAAAWAVGEWFCDHALAAFSRMGADPRVAMANESSDGSAAITPSTSRCGTSTSTSVTWTARPISFRPWKCSKVVASCVTVRTTTLAVAQGANDRPPSTSTLEHIHTIHGIRRSTIQKPILCILCRLP